MNTLIAWFSWSGNTRDIAERIARKTRGELFRIEREVPYSTDYGDFQTVRNVDYVQQIVEENDLNERGYFIYHAVGTEDVVKSQTLMMAEEMLSRDGVFPPEHYVFYQKEGGHHDFDAVQEFMFNALPLFFGLD